MREKICGIYCIENLVNGKKYIGKAVDIRSRWNQHRTTLRRNISESPYLQSSWNKYGEKNFEFKIIEICLPEETSKKEIEYIFILNTMSPNGYNLTKGGDGANGLKHTEETKLKISMANKGKILSDETKEKLSVSRKGKKFKPHSEETKRKISDGNKGKVISKEIREKARLSRIGIPTTLGYKHTEESKRKISENKLGFFKKKTINSKSIYFGVSPRKGAGKYKNRIYGYTVRLTVARKGVDLGRFKNEIDAARAYDKYIIENNLPHPLNFPENYPERGENK